MVDRRQSENEIKSNDKNIKNSNYFGNGKTEFLSEVNYKVQSEIKASTVEYKQPPSKKVKHFF